MFKRLKLGESLPKFSESSLSDLSPRLLLFFLLLYDAPISRSQQLSRYRCLLLFFLVFLVWMLHYSIGNLVDFDLQLWHESVHNVYFHCNLKLRRVSLPISFPDVLFYYVFYFRSFDVLVQLFKWSVYLIVRSFVLLKELATAQWRWVQSFGRCFQVGEGRHLATAKGCFLAHLVIPFRYLLDATPYVFYLVFLPLFHFPDLSLVMQCDIIN